MVRFEQLEPLPHILLQREPEQRGIRPRRPYGPRATPRPNRREHAELMRQQTAVSARQLARLRALFGVVPGRLLVLRLESLDVNQRETLERLNISVVEEVVEKRDIRTVYRLLVQFPDDQSLVTFTAEYDRYAEETDATTALPYGMRRDLFDTLDSVSVVGAYEKTGRRLRREGFPTQEPFYLDVDLWNPGADDAYRDLLNSFRKFVKSRSGRIVRDPLRIPSLILVKVEGNPQLLNDLLQLDLVSLVDLPPVPLPEDSFDLMQPVQVPERLPPVPADGHRLRGCTLPGAGRISELSQSPGDRSFCHGSDSGGYGA